MRECVCAYQRWIRWLNLLLLSQLMLLLGMLLQYIHIHLHWCAVQQAFGHALYATSIYRFPCRWKKNKHRISTSQLPKKWINLCSASNPATWTESRKKRFESHCITSGCVVYVLIYLKSPKYQYYMDPYIQFVFGNGYKMSMTQTEIHCSNSQLL